MRSVPDLCEELNYFGLFMMRSIVSTSVLIRKPAILIMAGKKKSPIFNVRIAAYV
jgi:hypothetical protein